MLIYSENRVSLPELEKIFSDKTNRLLFINTYSFFGDDGNNEFYKKFINDYFDQSRLGAQVDAIELSIILGLYQEHYLETIERILKSRRIEDIKLTCLDWLSQFHHNIPKQRYDEINSLMAAPAKTELLRLQALLNLLYVNRFPTIATSILSLFKTTDNPRLFYRLINNLSENAPLWYTFGASTLREIKFLCNEKNFNVKQKKELEHKFDNLKSYYEN